MLNSGCQGETQLSMALVSCTARTKSGVVGNCFQLVRYIERHDVSPVFLQSDHLGSLQFMRPAHLNLQLCAGHPPSTWQKELPERSKALTWRLINRKDCAGTTFSAIFQHRCQSVLTVLSSWCDRTCLGQTCLSFLFTTSQTDFQMPVIVAQIT